MPPYYNYTCLYITIFCKCHTTIYFLCTQLLCKCHATVYCFLHTRTTLQMPTLINWFFFNTFSIQNNFILSCDNKNNCLGIFQVKVSRSVFQRWGEQRLEYWENPPLPIPESLAGGSWTEAELYPTYSDRGDQLL